MTTILFLKNFKRLNSLKKSIDLSSHRSLSYLLTKLSERNVIDVKGKDCFEYIQGLVTNDIRHLCPTRETSVCYDCINSFMLNRSGRVITDLFIYKHDNDFEDKNINHLLLEMDSQMSPKMTKFLQYFRVRRKVEIQVRDDLEVWSLFPSVDSFDEQTVQQLTDNDIDFDELKSKEVVIVSDPRLKQMGFRFLVNKENNEIKQKIETLLNSKSVEVSEADVSDYHKFRYRLGVGEGVKDFPIEICFPLECNGDFLHAISFQKGCYVGQELTAKIYHTGVIRKRLMPIEFIDGDDSGRDNIEVQNVVDNEGRNVGKFRSNSGQYGLALLRVEDTLKTNCLKLSDSSLQFKCWRPFWWPKESVRKAEQTIQ